MIGSMRKWLVILALGLGTLPLSVHAEVEIAEVLWHIDGRTRQWAMENITDLEPGRRFSTEASLGLHLAAQRQLLFNQRQLQTVTIEYTHLLEPTEQPEVTYRPVRVDVFVTDTWNLVALPYFRYDSNDGLLLSIRMRDYNFFGSLEALRINLDYERTETNDDIISLDTTLNYPFRLWERNWELLFNQGLEIEYDSVDFTAAVGLGYYFSWLGLKWRTQLLERIRIMNQDSEGDDYYFTSQWNLAAEINTPFTLPHYGSIQYKPDLSVRYNHRPGGVSDERRGIVPGFEHSLAAGGYDWIGNYRQGNELTLGNRNRYNIFRDEFTSAITARTSHYRPLQSQNDRSLERWPKAGISGSLSGFYYPTGVPEDQDNAAEDIRGVLNDTMRGDLGLFLNLDATVTVLTIPRLAEGQLNVFFDTGFVRELGGPSGLAATGRRDVKFGTGLEVVGFPLFARSLYLRISYGIDLWRVIDDGDSPLDSRARVIFIGLRHHY